MLTSSTLIVVLLVGIGIPLITDLITKRGAPGWLKSLVTLLLSTATGILVPLEQQPVVHWKQVAFSIIGAFVVASAAHYNAWSPFRVTGDAGIIQATVPIGISTSSTPRTPPTGETGLVGVILLGLLLTAVFVGLGAAIHLLWLGIVLGLVVVTVLAFTQSP